MSNHAIAYTAIITVNAMLVAFEALLVSGVVPLPVSVAWVTPCLVAGLTVLTTQLPKLEAADVTPEQPK